MRELPGYSCWPRFDADETRAASDILTSGKVNYWTGNHGRTFESNFARHMQCDYGIALANGTLALDLALNLLGVGAGDEVIVTPRSYFASVSSIIMAGAKPVFVDVDADSQNITAETIEKAITPATKALLPVHLAGWPCDMRAIMALAEAHDLKVIEDCAQSHGAKLDDQMTGSFGHIGAFSFCQDKIMSTAGEGGIITTNDEGLWNAGWSFKDHGKSFDAVFNKEHPIGFRWLHESIGTNWRLTEIQCAIGQIQLDKLPEWINRRRAFAAIYNERFAGLSALRLTRPPENVYHAYYKYYMFVRPEALKSGWTRDRIMAEVVADGVPCFSGSCPEIYREKAITDLGLAPAERLPVAKELGETSLMLLVHPTLEESEVREGAERVAAVVARATKQS